jgi:hypothetical protein
MAPLVVELFLPKLDTQCAEINRYKIGGVSPLLGKESTQPRSRVHRKVSS